MDDKPTIYGEAITILQMEYFNMLGILRKLKLLPDIEENKYVDKQLKDLEKRLSRVNFAIRFLSSNDREIPEEE